MAAIGPGDARPPLSRTGSLRLTGAHDLGGRDAIPRRAGTGGLRLRPARRWLDGQQLRRGDGRVGRRPAGRHHVDGEAQPRPARRGGRGCGARSADRGEHPPPPRPHLRQRLPAGETTVIGHDQCREGVLRAGLKATKVLPADYGDLVVRPPDVTVDSDMTLHLDESAVELQVDGSGPHHQRHRRLAARAEGVLRRRPGVLGRPAVLPGGFDRPASGRPSGGCGTSRPSALLPGHGPACRGDEVGRVLDDLEGYVDWVEDVAAESHAAGLTPAGGRPEAPRRPVQRLGRDRAVRLQPAPRLLRARPGVRASGSPAHPVPVAGHGRLPRRPHRLPRLTVGRGRPPAPVTSPGSGSLTSHRARTVAARPPRPASAEPCVPGPPRTRPAAAPPRRRSPAAP